MNGTGIIGLPGLKKIFQGFEVLEGAKNVTISVESEHSWKFTQDDPCFCALGWSFTIGNPTSSVQPYVFRSTAYLVDRSNKTITRYLLGLKERQMIDWFDKTGEFRPGTYVFTAPSLKCQLAYKPTGKKTAGTGSSGRTRRSARAPRVARLPLNV